MPVRLVLHRWSVDQPVLAGRTTLHCIASPDIDCQLVEFSLDGSWINLITSAPLPRIRPRSIWNGRPARYVYRIPRRTVRMEGFD